MVLYIIYIYICMQRRALDAKGPQQESNRVSFPLPASRAAYVYIYIYIYIYR